MITIIGIDHEYQNDDEDLAPDIAADQKRYVDQLRRTIRSTAATVVGEETFPDDSHSLAKKLAEELGATHVVVDMNPAERVQHGIPERYSDYDTRCTREEIERYHRLREQFMVNRLLQAQAGEQDSVLVCGSFHTYRLAELFWKRGYESDAITLLGAVALEDKRQLPDIPDTHGRWLYLTWDAVWSEERSDRPQTVIRHGDRVLFSKPANWQAIHDEYESICKILKEKYGERLRDVVPTPESEMWLYGDSLSGPIWRDWVRERVFGNCEPEPCVGLVGK